MRALAAHLIERRRPCPGRRPRRQLDFGPHGPSTSSAEPQACGRAPICIVAIGGDGTLLHAARMAAAARRAGARRESRAARLPRRRGPAATCSSASTTRSRALRARSARMLLQATVSGRTARRVAALALNDVVVRQARNRPHARPETWVNGAYVNTHARRRLRRLDVHRLDGLCAVLRRTDRAPGASRAIVLVPICPHTLSRPPDRRGRATASWKSSSPTAPRPRAQVVCDGIALVRSRARTAAARRARRGQRDAAASARATTTSASCAPSCTGAAAARRAAGRRLTRPCSRTCRSAISRSSTPIELELGPASRR